jgi:hypothetical protein
VVETALSADLADSQKTGVFCQSDPLTCKNPPKRRVHLGKLNNQNCPTRIVRNLLDQRRIYRDGQKIHLAALANMAD